MIDVIHFYKVDNLDNVRKFYGDILNLPLYKDQKTCLIYCLQGHGKIGFCTHHPKQKNDATCITIVYQTEDDVRKMHAHLKGKVSEIDEPAYNEAFHIYHFFAKDFEGLTLECQAFIK